MTARLLEIYLSDHLAAATAGVALARRSARNNAGNATGDFLQRLATEIAEDRRTLQRVALDLGVSGSRPKEVVASVAEKLGRLKPNGRMRGYSPLSRVLELEALSVGIAGKLALWQSLQAPPGLGRRLNDANLDELIERARRQRAQVEEHRIAAARTAFAGEATSGAIA